MENFEELLEKDALGQKELLDANEITAKELTDFYIKQIQTYNPSLNAVVHEMFDEAKDQVKNVDLNASPVAGLPFLIKDLNAIKNQPLTSGSKLHEDVIAPENDELVDRYEKAGLGVFRKNKHAGIWIFANDGADFIWTDEESLGIRSVTGWFQWWNVRSSSGRTRSFCTWK